MKDDRRMYDSRELDRIENAREAGLLEFIGKQIPSAETKGSWYELYREGDKIHACIYHGDGGLVAAHGIHSYEIEDYV